MLRLGLVGCGRLAERGYVPAAELADGVRLAAVADPVAERCERVAPGLPRFASAAELLNAHAADLVVLATPAKVLSKMLGGPLRRRSPRSSRSRPPGTPRR